MSTENKSDQQKRKLKNDIEEIIERSKKALKFIDDAELGEALHEMEEVDSTCQFVTAELDILEETEEQDGGKGIGAPPAPPEPEPAPAGS